MSIIPDCRSDEYYNQKYLHDCDKEFVRGYDWCTEEVVDNFFNNLEVYFEEDSFIMHMLNEEIPEYEHEEYDAEYTFNNREDEHRIVKTYWDKIRSKMLEWIESERDELITSMIDAMGDEYDRMKEQIDAEQSEDANR